MFRGFWGLKIVPGKTYSQTVDASFRLSNAALAATVEDDSRTSVVLTVDDKSFVLCSLTPGSIEQQTLDISLTEGEDITFESQGNNEVHLTGNFIAEDIDEDSDSDSEDGMDLSNISPEELQEMIDEGMIDPEQLLEEMGDLDDESYDSDDAEADERIREITAEDEAEMMDELEEDDESEEEPAPVPVAEVKIKKQAEKTKKAELKRKSEEEEAAKAKKTKKETKKEKDVKKEEVKKEKEPKKEKEEAKKEKEPKKEKKEGKSLKFQGGVEAEVKKEGTGNGVKKGARVGMYYIGKLTNGKVFDQNTKGKPFWFRLGAGEVIKGWDVGIVGMKKGGERRLTIPAAMAYGKRGAPPDIPPNASLVFDIRLVEFK
ncbi:peptidylprolyl isomerase fpr3 [Coemansia erecta]|nr:peptidylprolyl isomerase fpr3 [Coemansia sp. RSA 2618]KAJ2830804.1 peptidylprolyl isomerase fpr3 [Coemansia erecta]